MLRSCVLDFGGSWSIYLPLTKFSYNNSYQVSIQMAPFEAQYRRHCKSPIGWFELDEIKLLGPNLVQESMDKVRVIQERLLAAQSRQKTYVDHWRQDLEFSVGDQEFLKVSPMKGVLRFGKHEKLNPCYIESFKILERIGTVACKLALLLDLSMVHPIFHVSMLQKYIPDLSHILALQAVQLDEQLSYKEQPMAVMD